tara:strand:- start:94 stop:1248 length:1155 start_codon:yes stop_codon:yes gene_type:complete
MKKNIIILGSTGSIGKSLLKIIKKNKSIFSIKLLTAKTNYKDLLKQAKFFKVKNIIITDKKSYENAKKNRLNKNINIYNDFNHLNKFLKYRADYTMSSIIGIEGLKPTIKLIKHSKKIAIANKESIVCGWSLIDKELKKYKTKFLPIDSEHFSIWFALKDTKINQVDQIYITASGGPFLNTPLNKLKKIKISQALNHPSWKMGKKITIDSSTMMNKVFEIIEARNIFNIPYKKLNILTHPKSYLHAIIKFNNGLIKTILHDTTMEIPIQNTLLENSNNFFNSNEINLNVLNNLNLKEIDQTKFPLVKILKKLPNKNSLYETVLVAANDSIVEEYLRGKIKYSDINKKLWKFINNKEFEKYKRIKPKKIENILNLNKYVRLKINL